MNSRSYGPAVARALLSSEFKKLRFASGETQEAVATACEWSVAKFSRIENASSPVRKADLEALLRHYHVDESRFDEFNQRAREARTPGWWEDYDFGSDKGFEAYVGYEDGASSIRMWQPNVIPGLIQTPQYTLQTLEGWGVAADAITRGIKLREDRQRRVARRGPEQIYVLDQSVIERPPGSSMPEQLRHLLRVAEKPSVTIHIIPFSRGMHFGMQGPFVLLGFEGELDDVLYLESARRGDLFIAENRDQLGGPNVPKFENPSDLVAKYQDSFARLLKISLPAKESLELIERTANNLEQGSLDRIGSARVGGLHSKGGKVSGAKELSLKSGRN
jgi:transcriptional regulator with XRE-family HTH domain